MVPSWDARPREGVMSPIHACMNLVSGPELAPSQLGGSYIRKEEGAKSGTSSVYLCHDHGFDCFSMTHKKEEGHWMPSLPNHHSHQRERL